MIDKFSREHDQEHDNIHAWATDQIQIGIRIWICPAYLTDQPQGPASVVGVCLEMCSRPLAAQAGVLLIHS